MYKFNIREDFFTVMRNYTHSSRVLFISSDELIKIYAITHDVDIYCAEDIVDQLLYYLNNIVFSTVPVKMTDLVAFTKNFICLNRNICFCFLADFYVRNVEQNKELQGE